MRAPLLAFALLCLPLPAAAATNTFFLDGGGGSFNIHTIKSLRDMRFSTVIRQKYDFSCGSAALATLLTYHYQQPTDEMEVMKAMFEKGDAEKIRKQGFSMLDMKNYLASIGFHAEGFRESLDTLAHVGIPAIVLVNRRGYMHFVVITGVSKDKVAIGDPTLGTAIYPRSDFEKMWNGILFVMLDRKDIAHASFNTTQNWSPYGKPYFRHMLDQGELDSLTIDIARTPNYY